MAVEKDDQENHVGDSLINLVRSSWAFLGETIDLAALELRLARKSFFVIIVLYGLMALLLLSAWFFLLAMLAAFLVSYHWSLVIALLIVAVVNLLFIIPIFLMILHYRRNLTFSATRKQFHKQES